MTDCHRSFFFTRVLRDLPLGDHLLALGIHQLAVLVLLQTLKDVLAFGLGAKPLRDAHTERTLAHERREQREREKKKKKNKRNRTSRRRRTLIMCLQTLMS